MSSILDTSKFFPKNDDNIFSQQFLRTTLHNFRSSGTKNSGIHSLDEPGAFFFKPVFYFDSPDIVSGIPTGGLLYPAWLEYSQYESSGVTEDNFDGKTHASESLKRDASLPNSAYTYLLRNDEKERAKCLRLFIELLSNISIYSPWYFQAVAGLDSAVERKFYNEYKIDETRRNIKFDLLADSYDTRIGTMIDSYQSACFSWQSKRVIVPSNLRKFDMGLFLYLKPIQSKRGPLISYGEYDKDIDQASYKYLEFHNCEINLESFKFGDAFTNVEANGTQMKYSLSIDYDECYVDRYNDQFIGLIGDSIIQDIIDSTQDDFLNKQNTTYGQEVGGILDKLVKNVYSATIDKGLDAIKGKVVSSVLGNIYGLQTANNVKRLLDGQVFGITKKNYKQDATIDNKKLYDSTIQEEQEVDGNIYTSKSTPFEPYPLGNLYNNPKAVNSLIREL